MGGFSKKEKLAYVRAKKHLLHKKVIAPATPVDESEICIHLGQGYGRDFLAVF